LKEPWKNFEGIMEKASKNFEGTFELIGHYYQI
jgi:hypothetical protein